MTFPETRRSAISGLRDQDAVTRRQSLDAVAATYWAPVCAYLRLRWRETEADAADLTQTFFAKSIESDLFARYEPQRGAFRTYLRTCLDHFVLNLRRKRRIETGPIDQEIADGAQSAEELFHREWARNLFHLAVEDLRARRDAVRFAIFEQYDLHDSDQRPTYQQLAVEFDISERTVTNYLAAMRRDLRNAVLARLRDSTSTEREYRSEARSILGVDL